MRVPKPQALPSGKFRVQFMLDGERVSVIDDDPDRAQAKAVAIRARLIEAAKEPRDAITLKAAIEKYIAARSNVLSPATIRGYHVIVDHRFPALMKKRVYKITESDLQIAINDDAEKVGRKTLKNAMGLVLAVLGEYKTVNPKRLRYPQAPRKEHAYLEGKQIAKLITACVGDTAEIPILMGVWLGMRRSEILGLQWESIDLERGTIAVDHSLVYDKDDQPILKTAMKTEASNRVLSCPRYILAKLEEYQPDPSRRRGTVFGMHPNTIYQNLEKICKRAGIPFVGVHGLRHTNASVMLSLGIIDKIIMSRGGWSSKYTVERVYEHLFSEDKAAAEKNINSYFEALIAQNFTHDETASPETKGG